MSDEYGSRPSREVLSRFLNGVRRAFVNSPDVLGCVKMRLASPAGGTSNPQRKQLLNWLEMQIGWIEQDTALHGGERISRQLDNLLRPTEPDNLCILRRELLERLARGLRTTDELDAKFLHDLVCSGLGVAFMRYSHAMRLSYYHVLETDLLPSHIGESIRRSSLVPDWSGTIGWISRAAFLEIREHGDDFDYGIEDLQPTVLWSCFSDPKGRVAMEDLVLGNRSFIAIPVIDMASDPSSPGQPSRRTMPQIIGIVFCFFPLDGIFKDAGERDSNLERAVKDRFLREWQRCKAELIGALQLEGVENLYTVSRRSSLAAVERFYSRGESEGLTDQGRRRAWLQQTMFGAPGDPSDALGFQLVVDLEQDLRRPNEPLKCSFLFREETFIHEVLDRFQLSCRCPIRWAPRCVWQLQSIHDSLHGTPSHEPTRPVWRIGAGDPGKATERSAFVDQLYPPSAVPDHMRFRDRMNRLLGDEADVAWAESVNANKKIYRHFGWADELEPLSSEQRAGNGDDPFRLRQIVRHLSPPDRISDLLVPLVHDGCCTGFIEIKCLSEALNNGQIDSTTAETFHALYRLFDEDFQRLRACLAELLAKFERELDQVSSDLPSLKTWLDIRLSFCDAVAKAICRGVSSSKDSQQSDFQSQLNLVVKAAFMEAQTAAIDTNQSSSSCDGQLSATAAKELSERVEACAREFAAFVDAARSCRLPDVVLVTVWLCRERPTIIGAGIDVRPGAPSEPIEKWIKGNLQALHELLVDDPASMQFIRLFLRWCRQRAKGDLEYVRIEGQQGRYAVRDVAGQGDDEAGLPPTFERPPLYVSIDRDPSSPSPKLGTCDSILFRTHDVRLKTGCREVVCQTIFRLKSEDSAGLRIDWRWVRSPMPAAVDYVRSTVGRLLFGADHRTEPHRIRLSERALQRLEDTTRNGQDEWRPLQLPLEVAIEACQAPDGRSQDIVTRAVDILKFLPNREHWYGECRFISTVVDDVRYAILAQGLNPEHRQIRRLRDDAVTGALGDIALLMQTSAVKLARDHSNHIRYMAHQLSNDFVDAYNMIPLLDKAAVRGNLEQVRTRARVLKERFNNLRCLTLCLLYNVSQIDEFRDDVVTLLESLTKWKLCGLARYADGKPVALESLTKVTPDGLDLVLELAIDPQIDREAARFEAGVTRDLFLVFNCLLTNAIKAAQGRCRSHVVYVSAHNAVLGGEAVLEFAIRNTAEKPIDSRFKDYVQCDSAIEPVLPWKDEIERTEYKGLWTVRYLLQKNAFARAKVEDWSYADGEHGVAIVFRVPIRDRGIALPDRI